MEKPSEQRRENIKRLLWERSFTRDLEEQMRMGLVSPLHIDEYLGKVTNGPPYLNALAKMLSALLINQYFDRVVDEVIKIDEYLKEWEERQKPAEIKKPVVVLPKNYPVKKSLVDEIKAQGYEVRWE